MPLLLEQFYGGHSSLMNMRKLRLKNSEVQDLKTVNKKKQKTNETKKRKEDKISKPTMSLQREGERKGDVWCVCVCVCVCVF